MSAIGKKMDVSVRLQEQVKVGEETWWISRGLYEGTFNTLA